MIKKKRIRIPIYKGFITLVKSDNFQEVKDTMLPLWNNKDFFAHTFVQASSNDNSVYVVFNTTSNITDAVIAHEYVHVASIVLGDRGVVADLDNDEPVAYFVEWLFAEIQHFMHKS